MMVRWFLVAGFGTPASAVYGVGASVLQLATTHVTGAAMAVAALVGRNIGTGNAGRAELITWLGTVVSSPR